MYWEERLERIKKRNSPEDLVIPFTIWSSVFKKIERKFIIKKNSNSHFNFWAGAIKEKTFVKDIPIQLLSMELNKLNQSLNYWVVLVLGDTSASRHFLCDAKVKVIHELLDNCAHDFYILDKKYNWFLYFNRVKDQNTVFLYKSGKSVLL